MTHKVLIPLDGSDLSRHILPHVREFLDPQKNEIILLRVAEEPQGAVGRPPKPATESGTRVPVYESVRDIEEARHPIYKSQMEDTIRAALEEELFADAAGLREAGFQVAVAVRFGDPAQEIIDFVKEESIDLVAMATHGRSGLRRLIMGSVAERVLRNLAIPVLMVRPFEQPAETLAPGQVLAERLAKGERLHIAVATDGSVFAQTATAFAGQLARALSAEITLIAAVRENGGAVRAKKVLDEARELLGEIQPAPKTVPLVGYPDEVIIHYLAQNPADLLVLGAFGDRGATRFFIGSTAERLVQHAPTSVLVVKGHRPAYERLLACTAMGDEVVVDVGVHLARRLGSTLECFHVTPPSPGMYLSWHDIPDISLDEILSRDTPLARYMKRCIEKLEAAGFSREAVVVHRGEVPDAIFEEANRGNFDLIVVGSQAGPVPDRYFRMGSVAERIAKFAHQSVLVVRTTRQ